MFRAVVLIAAVVLAADQATKYWAESALSDGQTITLLGDLLQLRLVYNPGAAFSIGAAYTWIFAVFAAAAVVAVTVVAWRVTSRAWAVALGLVLGGATTHLLDRSSGSRGSPGGTWWTSSTTPGSSSATSPTSPWWSGWASSWCSTCAASRCGTGERGREQVSSAPVPPTRTTSRRRGPCTPSTRSSSMSLVADGPEIQVNGARGSAG